MDPQPGDHVAVLFSVDCLYYRAEIACFVKNSVTVYLMYLGLYYQTDIKDLREMPKCIRNIPPQAEKKNQHHSTATALPQFETQIPKITKELERNHDLLMDPQPGDQVAALFSIDYNHFDLSCYRAEVFNRSLIALRAMANEVQEELDFRQRFEIEKRLLGEF